MVPVGSTGAGSALAAIGAFASLLLIPAFADFALFYSDPSKTGVANARLLGAADVSCEGLVLVRFTEHDAIYRCPVGFVWGEYSRFPFAPQYEEGRSAQLKDNIAATMANAQHVGDDREKTRD